MATSTIYTIDSTDGITTLVIQPRTFNGEGGVIHNTDLTFYGNAATSWGERFNENFYRLLENFSCPEKSGSPGTPQDENDIATGLGINNPIRGQLWFNSTTEELYVQTKDTSSSGTPIWKRMATADDIQGLGVADISGLQTSLNTLTNGKVDRAGDSGLTGTHSWPNLFLNEGNGNLDAGPDIRMTASGLISCDSTLQLHFGASGVGNFVVSRNAPGEHTGVNDVPLLNVNYTGMISESIDATTYASNVASGVDNLIPNKKYVNDQINSINITGFVQDTGDSMSGQLYILTSEDIPLHIQGVSPGPSGSNPGDFGGGNFFFHGTSLGSDSGGLLLQCGDNNNDEYAIKIENHHVGIGGHSGEPAERRVWGIKATSGDTYWRGQARVFLAIDPLSDLEAATKRYVDDQITAVTASTAALTKYNEIIDPFPLHVNPTAPHSLGEQPKLIQISLVNVVAEYGYNIGEEILLENERGAQTPTTWADPNFVGMHHDSTTFTYNGKHTVNGSRHTLTVSSWRTKFRVWA